MRDRTIGRVGYGRLEMLAHIGHGPITIVGHIANAVMVVMVAVVGGDGDEDVSYNVMMEVRLTSVIVTDPGWLSGVDQVRIVVLMKLESSGVGHGVGVLIETTSLGSYALLEMRIVAARLVKVGLLTKSRVWAVDRIRDSSTTVIIGALPWMLHTRTSNIRITGGTGAGEVRGRDCGRNLGRLLHGNFIRHSGFLALLV